MGTPKLLPCPFCGSRDVLLDDDTAFATIYCENCGADGAPSLDPNEAAAAWNRRSDRAGLITGLREALATVDAHFAAFDTTGERLACRLIGHDIRARITALEEEGKS